MQHKHNTRDPTTCLASQGGCNTPRHAAVLPQLTATPNNRNIDTFQATRTFTTTRVCCK